MPLDAVAETDAPRNVAGGFSGWNRDPAKHGKPFDRLLKRPQAESQHGAHAMEMQVWTRFPTPQHFFEWAEQLSNRIKDRDGVRWLRILYPDVGRIRDWRLDSDTPPVTLYLGARVGQQVFTTWTNKDDLGVGKVVAQKGPGETTILFVSAGDDVWPKAEPYWKILYSHMESQGWIDVLQRASSSPDPPNAPSGERKRRTQRAAELTLDEIVVLEGAAARGDLQARQELDDAARADGFKDWEELLSKQFRPMVEKFIEAVDQAMGNAVGVSGKISDDDAFKMLVARLRQLEISNDPVLGFLAESARRMPLVQAVKAIHARMDRPSTVPPTSTHAQILGALPLPAPSTYTCFIAHSHEDEEFCTRLCADLRAHGIELWRFADDAKWGQTVWGEIEHNIERHDKLVVICSKDSLQSGPVLREIERALDREDKEGKGILFPVRIDDYIFELWKHERRPDVLRKVVGDFRSWDKDAAMYEKAFDKLLRGLQPGSRKA